MHDDLDSRLVHSGYVLGEEIGRGGFARVHVAEPVGGGDAVAIKVAVRPELVAALRSEGQLLRRLESPYFVRILEEVVDADPPYAVLEYCAGGDLRRHMEEAGGRLAPAEVERLLTPVLEGMAFAHEEGIVHGDLKPENVLLTADGAPKIADLGLSRAQRRKLLFDREAVAPSLPSEEATVRGTFDYISPEIRAGQGLTPAGDVYALGVTAYELLVGRRPLGLVEPPALVLGREDPPLAVPAHLDRVVIRALARDTGARYPDAGIMLADLRAGPDGIELPDLVPHTGSDLPLRGNRPVSDAVFLPLLFLMMFLPPAIAIAVFVLASAVQFDPWSLASWASLGLLVVTPMLLVWAGDRLLRPLLKASLR
jgi:serine/threonine protein kinase